MFISDDVVKCCPASYLLQCKHNYIKADMCSRCVLVLGFLVHTLHKYAQCSKKWMLHFFFDSKLWDMEAEL